jgi:hypothetical protein
LETVLEEKQQEILQKEKEIKSQRKEILNQNEVLEESISKTQARIKNFARSVKVSEEAKTFSHLKSKNSTNLFAKKTKSRLHF